MHQHGHSFKTIKIPGGNTLAETEPEVHIHGGDNNPFELIIKYRIISSERTGHHFGKITFRGVLEYRWISETLWYYPYEDENNFAFGLLEIYKSKYLDDIKAKGKYSHLPDKRFGPYINENEVKHFRFSFDHYGYFDIVAFEAIIEETSE